MKLILSYRNTMTIGCENEDSGSRVCVKRGYPEHSIINKKEHVICSEEIRKGELYLLVKNFIMV